MAQNRPRHNPWLLVALIFLMTLYTSLLSMRFPLTSTVQLDGILGVLLGLYACTHPASNVIDLLFYARGAYRQGFTKQSYYILWWGLNGLVLFVGWWVISVSLIRFTSVR